MSSHLKPHAALYALGLAVLGSVVVGCNGATTGDEVDATATSYGSMGERLVGADYDRWIGVRAQLIKNLADKCGDTFCGGDYSNLTHVALDCSATKAGTINQCTWVIAGSIEYVDGATGSISVDQRTLTCPIAVHTKVTPFLDALTDDDNALQATVPGTGKSFYDGLAQCLSGVVGKAPPKSTGTKYRELVDYLNDHSDFFPWWQARKRLVKAFDDVCGDTFCEGDYSDISALGLACAVEEATGTVKSCTWNFAGAYETVTTKGKVSAHNKSWSCPVTINAPANDLVTALSGADPLHAALPGQTTTLMDALGNCL